MNMVEGNPGARVIYMPSYLLSRLATYKEKLKFPWNHRGDFSYPYIFVTYADGKHFADLRNFWEVDSNKGLIMSDSGGFQILARGENEDAPQDTRINPEDVIEWQNKNCDVAMTLDEPPYDSVYKTALFKWEEKMAQTVLNTKIALDRKKGGLQLYATIHGLDESNWFDWKIAVDSAGGLDGYAIGLPSKPNIIIEFLKFVLDHKIEKPLHFFKMGGSTEFLLLSRFSKYYPSLITVDASSFMIHMNSYTQVLSPTNLSQTIEIGDRSDNFSHTRVGCLCPVCQNNKELSNQEFRLFGYFAFHNLYMFAWHYEYLNSIAGERVGTIRNLLGDYNARYIEVIDRICARHADPNIKIQSGLEDYFQGRN